MNQLKQYIENQIKKGYSLKQVEQFLLQNNYSQKTINQAISKIQEEQHLNQVKNYIQKTINQGYAPEQVEQYLLTKGYSQKQLKKIFEEIYIPQSATPIKIIHEHKIETNTLIKVGTMMFLIIIAIFGGVLALHQSPESRPTKLLDLKTNAQTISLKPGSNLEFKLSMINQGDPGRVDIYLTYTVETEDGKIVLKQQETKAFETTITDIKTIKLPTDLPEGTYQMKVIANYLDQEAKSGFTFYIKTNKTKSSNTKKTEIKQINKTSESENKKINNLKQETKKMSETERSNPSDDELLSKALTSKTITEANNNCEQIQNPTLKDNCFSFIATNYKKETYCEKITSESPKEDCKMFFIRQGQTNLCQELKLPENKRLCDQWKVIEKLENYRKTNNTDALIGDVKITPITENNISEQNNTIEEMGPADFIK